MTEYYVSSPLLLPILDIFPQFCLILENKMLLQDPAKPNSLRFKGFQVRGVQNVILGVVVTSCGLIQPHLCKFLHSKINETVKNEEKHLKVTGF